MRAIAWVLAAVGVSIAGLWTVLLATGQVPELSEGRLDIWFHLVAEYGAAALLVTAGIALLRGLRHARLLAAGGLGALAYTAVNSAGYYADLGDWSMVGMFALILTASLAMALRLARSAAADPSGPHRTAKEATPPSSSISAR
jgi:hypothetical protein